MFIWKVMENRKKKNAIILCLLVVFGFIIPSSAPACSCVWKGPFLTAAQDAPLVIIGKILRHHPGKSPTMDVLVLETLKGGILDSGMNIQMGDGMYCRPTVDVFPVGSRWVLAINGAGAKPGDGWAISHCGEYWLKIEGENVTGSIDGDMKQVKRMPLKEFKNRFLYPKFSQKFSGRVEAGQAFRRAFGGRFEFILEPMAQGWEIVVKEFGRDENLARLTPPFHFAPNPREIEGWHFLKNPSQCADRPYNADAGPENPRKFIFSPEVGKTIAGPDSNKAFIDENINAVKKFGRGEMNIKKFKLALGTDGCPRIEWLEFTVKIDGGY
ncbi:MAG TPA: hypothetical protein PKI91_03755 [Smithella sp.]|nr:hypothetical protein [Smithella sp.]MDM7987790.1 hypothetical protein [Smithella sp.]HNY49655.1 hypothetical protein [Smithella sp.]HQI73939.1 hypothetical protein [Smithella sp.]